MVAFAVQNVGILRGPARNSVRKQRTVLYASMDVTVTGCTGRTGQLVFQKLLDRSEFNAHGFARDEKKAKELFGSSDIVIGSVLSKDDLRKAISKCEKLVILTSAIPQVKPSEKEGEPPSFEYKETPQQVMKSTLSFGHPLGDLTLWLSAGDRSMKKVIRTRLTSRKNAA